MSRPLLLDLFCGAGGAAMGYYRAGFDVVGVDINVQPNYPFEFWKDDALAFLDRHGWDFAVVHASPPCQAYTSLRHIHKNDHPDLVAATRERLRAHGGVYVIENVPGAPLVDPITLCGASFGLGVAALGRVLKRHRLFESNVPLRAKPCACKGRQIVGVYGHGGGGQMTRGFKATLPMAREAIGAPWMDRKGLSQAIPPAYTEFIGRQILENG